MKKIISVILMISFILVSVVCGVYADKIDEVAFTSNSAIIEEDDVEAMFQEYNAVMAEQINATKAYKKLSELFSVSDNGATIYPEKYAGSWIDGSNLVIAVTEKSEIDYYKDFLSEYDCVEFVVKKYSLRELDVFKRQIANTLRNNTTDVNSYYTDVKENKVVFYVGDDAADTTAIKNSVVNNIDVARAEERGLQSSSSSTVLQSMVDDVEKLLVVKSGGKITPQAYLYGGSQIKRGSATSLYNYSIGICGTIHLSHGDYDGIITAGHGMEISGTNQRMYFNGSEFGRTSAIMFRDGGNGDWAAVRITSDDTMINKVYGSSSSVVRKIVDVENDLTVDTTFFKYGCNGGFCTGTVIAQDVTMPTTWNNEIIEIDGMTLCTLDSGTSVGGDSGGPYYISNDIGGNNYNFVGVHHGYYYDEDEDQEYIYFTPYIRFSSYFTPLTD